MRSAGQVYLGKGADDVAERAPVRKEAVSSIAASTARPLCRRAAPAVVGQASIISPPSTLPSRFAWLSWRCDAEPGGDRPADQPGTNYLIVGPDKADDLTAAQRKVLPRPASAAAPTPTRSSSCTPAPAAAR